jgi:hypothetical protein
METRNLSTLFNELKNRLNDVEVDYIEDGDNLILSLSIINLSLNDLDLFGVEINIELKNGIIDFTVIDQKGSIVYHNFIKSKNNLSLLLIEKIIINTHGLLISNNNNFDKLFDQLPEY